MDTRREIREFLESTELRTRWAAHNVRRHITGIKHFHHTDHT